MADAENNIQFKATASTTIVKGFTAVYQLPEEEESPKEISQAKQYKALCKAEEGDEIKSVVPEKSAHATKPPPRYTDASIVRTMESLGIGRPSTFAATTAVLVVHLPLDAS